LCGRNVRAAREDLKNFRRGPSRQPQKPEHGPTNSFDIASKLDRSEIVNAIDQTMKEVRQRFDFRAATRKFGWRKDLVLTARTTPSCAT
jgi:hypothetical protein